MSFRMSQEAQGPTYYLRLGGAVDLSTTPGILRAIKTAFRKAGEGVVVDLGEVNHMDSSGIAALVEGVREGRRTGKAFRLSRLPDRVRGVLELANLVEFFDYEE
jgi:anti-anti-sigma factor